MNLEERFEALRNGDVLFYRKEECFFKLSDNGLNIVQANSYSPGDWNEVWIWEGGDFFLGDDDDFEVWELRPKLERDYTASNIELLSELELGFQRLLREIASPDTMMSDAVTIPFAHDSGQRFAYNRALEMVQSRKIIFELRSKERE